MKTLPGKQPVATRWMLSVGLGGSFLAMEATRAQHTPETQSADRVVVTGSNVPTSENVGPSPVDTVD